MCGYRHDQRFKRYTAQHIDCVESPPFFRPVVASQALWKQILKGETYRRENVACGASREVMQKYAAILQLTDRQGGAAYCEQGTVRSSGPGRSVLRRGEERANCGRS